MRIHAAIGKRVKALLLAGVMAFSLVPSMGTISAAEYQSENGLLKDIGSLQISDESDGDGGCAEIVKYNPDNNSYYVVDGKDSRLSIVKLDDLTSDKTENEALLSEEGKKTDIEFSDIESLIQTEGNNPDFELGDLTSVAVNTQKDLIAVAVQSVNTTTPGVVAVLDYDGNYLAHFNTGVQPDMVTFTPDGNYILTADEGEPRDGYDDGAVDPQGSVTIVDITDGLEGATSNVVTFEEFDDESARQDLVDAGVILKKDTAPSVDLEPEYLAVAGDTAYVSLQEANAIATLDIEEGKFTAVKGLGVKDYTNVKIDVNKEDKQANLKEESRLRGLYMPDGIAAYEVGGKTYLLTANEGDSRSDWPGYTNEEELGKNTLAAGYGKIRYLNITDYDGPWGKAEDQEIGADAPLYYLFGGRSFSIWDADDMTQVYDSGSTFEEKTAELLPDYFNCSNDTAEIEDRSGKKGPEPEYVTVGEVDGKPYAFIGLERISGVMAYDLSNVENPEYADYLNTRDFSEDIKGDVSPEGLDFVPAQDSPNGAALLLVGNEVSGTVSMMLVGDILTPSPVEGLKLAIISDDHLYDGEELGTAGEDFQDYLNNDRKMIAESEKILDEAIERIKNSDADYVLVSGDLTKDGEKHNHELLAEKLKALENSTGKQVFVINGNHDLSNQNAKSFTESGAARVETVNRNDFKSIYADLGYDLAVAKDSGSLSYAADLGDDYRLIVIDSCIYNNDKANPNQETGGELPAARLNWVLAQIKDAIQDGKRPIGMLHHGLVPHTAVQSTFFEDYLLKDYEKVSQQLADAGLGIVFTGHFHSQDVAVTETAKGNKLYDMETGSLVTYPSPIRHVTLDGSKVTYTSEFIGDADALDGLNPADGNVSAPDIYDAADGNFSAYAQAYLLDGLQKQVPGMLAYVLVKNGAAPSLEAAMPTALGLANSQPFTSFGLNITLGEFLATCMAEHYAGDEDLSEPFATIIGVLQNYSQADAATNGLYQMLGNAAWALANDTTGTWADPKPDTVPDNGGGMTLSALPSYSGGGSSGNGSSGGGSPSGSSRTVVENGQTSGQPAAGKPVVSVKTDAQGNPIVTLSASPLPNARQLTAAEIAQRAANGTLNETVNPNGVWDGRTTGANNVALVIDTSAATLAPGGSHQLGISAFAGPTGCTLRIRASRDGFVTITANADGTYTITANRPVSDLYILVEILDANGNVIGHSSMKLNAAAGLAPGRVENKAATIA